MLNRLRQMRQRPSSASRSPSCLKQSIIITITAGCILAFTLSMVIFNNIDSDEATELSVQHRIFVEHERGTLHTTHLRAPRKSVNTSHFSLLTNAKRLQTGQHDKTIETIPDSGTNPLSAINSEDPFGYPLYTSNRTPFLPTITATDSLGYLEKATYKIVVITMNRARSLQRLLTTLLLTKFDGRAASLHILIDVDPDTNQLDSDTVQVADSFQWPFGEKVVVKRDKNIGLIRSWLEAWSRRSHRYEIGVILEDDVVVSPFFARWLRYAHAAYGSRDDVSGFSLQNPIQVADEKVHETHESIEPPDSSKYPSFLYRLIGTWGFSPRWESWHRFIRWYQIQQLSDRIPLPVVDDILMSTWYKIFLRQGREGSMWSMWHIRYTESFRQFVVFSNLPPLTKGETAGFSAYFLPGGSALAASYQDKGLHIDTQRTNPLKPPLLSSWDKKWAGLRGLRLLFPDKPVELDFDGSILPSPPSPLQLEASVFQQIWQYSGTVAFNLVNKVYLDLARSWLCNMLQSSWANDMPMLLWLALDSESLESLEQFKFDQIAAHPEYKPVLERFIIVRGFEKGQEQTTEMMYGVTAYWQLMWQRTEFLLRLLHSGVNIFIFETDCTWLQNGLRLFQEKISEGNDVVANITPLNRGGKQYSLTGGLMWLHATVHTQRLWEDVTAKFHRIIMADIKANRPHDEYHELENHQTIFTWLLTDSGHNYVNHINKIKWAGIGYEYFPDGRWYNEEQGRPQHPYVISNNWIRGISNKIQRAKKHRHWFYNSKKRQCNNNVILSKV